MVSRSCSWTSEQIWVIWSVRLEIFSSPRVGAYPWMPWSARADSAVSQILPPIRPSEVCTGSQVVRSFQASVDIFPPWTQMNDTILSPVCIQWCLQLYKSVLIPRLYSKFPIGLFSCGNLNIKHWIWGREWVSDGTWLWERTIWHEKNNLISEMGSMNHRYSVYY